MKKSAIKKMPAYFDRYINLTDDVSYLEALDTSLQELFELPIEKWNALQEKVYAPGKWTAKDILQHLIDTERVFSYRMTAFARGDQQQMLSFDEELFGKNADANRRPIEDILEELTIVSKSYIAQYKSYTPEMLNRSGKDLMVLNFPFCRWVL